MKFNFKVFINNLIKLLLFVSFFFVGYWTRAEIDYFNSVNNLKLIEKLQAETDQQQREIDNLKEQTQKIELIFEKISKLEEKHK